MNILSNLEQLIQKNNPNSTLDKYLSSNLLSILETAMVSDQRGELQIDYKTRLKTIETIMKLSNPNMGS